MARSLDTRDNSEQLRAMKEIQDAVLHLKAAIQSLNKARDSQPRFVVDLLNTIIGQAQGYLNYVELIETVFSGQSRGTVEAPKRQRRKQS